MRRLLIALAVVFVCTPARADFATGVFAYLNGQYDVALDTMRSLAETTDHAYARYYLGMMYSKGQGVEQDDAQAATWFISAAKQGVQQAQYRVAEMYETGRGMPRDYESAYAWYTVAAKLGNKEAPEALARTADKLSEDELKHAQSLAQEYVNSYGKAPDGTQSVE